MSLFRLLLQVTQRVVINWERSLTTQEHGNISVVSLWNGLAVESLGDELANVALRSTANSIFVACSLDSTFDRASPLFRSQAIVDCGNSEWGRKATGTRIISCERGFMNWIRVKFTILMNEADCTRGSICLSLYVISLSVFVQLTLSSSYFHTAETNIFLRSGNTSVSWCRTYVIKNFIRISTCLHLSSLINDCICLHAVHLSLTWIVTTTTLTWSTTGWSFNLVAQEAIQGIIRLTTFTSTINSLRLRNTLVALLKIRRIIRFDSTRCLRLNEFIITCGGSRRVLSRFKHLSIMLLSLLHVLDWSLSNRLFGTFWNARGRAHTHIVLITCIRNISYFAFSQFSWSVTGFVLPELSALTNTISFISLIFLSEVELSSFWGNRLELAAANVSKAESSHSKVHIHISFALVNAFNNLITDSTQDLWHIFRGAVANLCDRCNIHGNEFFIKNGLFHIGNVFSVLT